MAESSKITRVRSLRKQILTILCDLYLFPQSAKSMATALKESYQGIDSAKIGDCFTYLDKKGYVATHKSRGRLAQASITARGVDLVEGAMKDRGILPTEINISTLKVKRDVRRAILSFLRQFPESFNADDEILAELKELGMTSVLLDQVRFNIWYLAEKKLLEMQTLPLRGDMVYYARITALGMDLLEGSVDDPGVSADE